MANKTPSLGPVAPKSRTTDKNATAPPDSTLPLTPPGTDERHAKLDFEVKHAIEVFESSLDPPVSCGPAPRIKLQAQQYKQLVGELGCNPQLGYIDDKVRYDYDSETSVLDIRMPTPVHEIVSNSVADEISEQLQCIVKQGGRAGDFAARILKGGSARIFLAGTNNTSRRQPDAQFQHERAAYPGLIVEISYSQDGKDLDKLAWDYIQGSDGDIKVVVGIDINYGGKASTVSLWRPHYYREDGDELDTLSVRRELVGEAFRSPDGSHENQEACLNLALSDFATDELCEGLDSATLSIRYGRLAELVDRAEQLQRAREEHMGVRSQKKLLKRKRTSSPPEGIGSDDESRFRAAESAAMKKSAAEDRDFQPSGR